MKDMDNKELPEDVAKRLALDTVRPNWTVNCTCDRWRDGDGYVSFCSRDDCPVCLLLRIEAKGESWLCPCIATDILRDPPGLDAADRAYNEQVERTLDLYESEEYRLAAITLEEETADEDTLREALKTFARIVAEATTILTEATAKYLAERGSGKSA